MNNGFINSSSQSISHGTISRSNQTPNGLDKLWLVCYFCCLTQTAILELKMQYSSILRITFFSLCDGPSDKRQCLIKSYVSRHLEALCLVIARIDRIIISWNEDCFKNWMTLIIFFFLLLSGNVLVVIWFILRANAQFVQGHSCWNLMAVTE